MRPLINMEICAGDKRKSVSMNGDEAVMDVNIITLLRRARCHLRWPPSEPARKKTSICVGAFAPPSFPYFLDELQSVVASKAVFRYHWAILIRFSYRQPVVYIDSFLFLFQEWIHQGELLPEMIQTRIDDRLLDILSVDLYTSDSLPQSKTRNPEDVLSSCGCLSHSDTHYLNRHMVGVRVPRDLDRALYHCPALAESLAVSDPTMILVIELLNSFISAY